MRNNDLTLSPFFARPLLWLFLTVAGGILCAYLTGASSDVGLVVLAGGAAVSLLLAIVTKFNRYGVMLLVSFAAGFFLCTSQQDRLDAWPLSEEGEVTVCGTVSGAPERREDERYRMQLRVETVNGAACDCADIYVYGRGEPPAPGSKVEVVGEYYRLSAAGNANAFDYEKYLRQQGIAAQVSVYFGGGVTVLREGSVWSPARFSVWLRDCFDVAAASLSERRHALVYGVFLGEKSGLDYELKNALQLSGLMHLFAVSGLHVGYIVMLALFLAGRGFCLRRRRVAFTLLFLLLYVCLTGLAASILRACVMALIVLLADVLIEQADGISSLSLAALCCLAVRPLWLFSAGFQLSFAAMWGLIVLTPLFERVCGGRQSTLFRLFAAAWAASIATLPLLCYYFYHITWLGWLLSPLVIPLTGVAVALCFVALPFSIVFPPLAALLLHAAGYLLDLIAVVAELIERVPLLATTTGAVSLLAVALFYLLLGGALLVFRVRRSTPALLGLVLLVALFFVSARAELSYGNDGLERVAAEIVFIDVGQGDSALIITEDGRSVLVDGGGKASAPGGVGQYVLLPYLKSRGLTELDVVISSHADVDHADGLLSVMQQIDVDTLILSGAEDAEGLNGELREAAQAQECKIETAWAGCEYVLGRELLLTVYHPRQGEECTDDNDASIVLELSVGDIDVLLTGDASGDALARLCRDYAVEAEIVKLPHHGSADGYNEEFYQRCGAQAVVLCVGAKNSYGHPQLNVIEYWQQRAQVFRTDSNGAVTILTDGEKWRAQTER